MCELRCPKGGCVLAHRSRVSPALAPPSAHPRCRGLTLSAPMAHRGPAASVLHPGLRGHLPGCQSRGAAARWALRPVLTGVAEQQLVWRAWLQVFQQVMHGVQQQ